jgi:NADPH:quinone reductase-like Zn-dependent oxidoreductase
MKIKAVVTTSLGGPAMLKLHDVDLTWPRGEHDVLVELRAAALNPTGAFFHQLDGYLIK